jgi:hypothetical protein
MPWSELPRWRLEVELAKIGTTISEFVCDARDVPELQPWIEDLSPDAKLQVALEWFGDEENPQPVERTDWPGFGRTPDWLGGRFPSLDEAEKPKPAKPHHRPPDPIPTATVKRLKWELVQRRAKPRDREYTQEKIAARLDLSRPRVQQAEKLESAGWDLLRSHPEFSAKDGFVRWPSAPEAAQIVASERAEN